MTFFHLRHCSTVQEGNHCNIQPRLCDNRRECQGPRERQDQTCWHRQRNCRQDSRVLFHWYDPEARREARDSLLISCSPQCAYIACYRCEATSSFVNITFIKVNRSSYSVNLESIVSACHRGPDFYGRAQTYLIHIKTKIPHRMRVK